MAKYILMSHHLNSHITRKLHVLYICKQILSYVQYLIAGIIAAFKWSQEDLHNDYRMQQFFRVITVIINKIWLQLLEVMIMPISKTLHVIKHLSTFQQTTRLKDSRFTFNTKMCIYFGITFCVFDLDFEWIMDAKI